MGTVYAVFSFLILTLSLIGWLFAPPWLIFTAFRPSDIALSSEWIEDVLLVIAALHAAVLWALILALRQFWRTRASVALAMALAALVLPALPPLFGTSVLLWDMVGSLEWSVRIAVLDGDPGRLQSSAGFVLTFALPVALLLGLGAVAAPCMRGFRVGRAAFVDWRRACAGAVAGVVLAYATAILFGADPFGIVRQAWFHVLVVPAVVGIGVSAKLPSMRWFPFAMIALAALMAHYALVRGKTDDYRVQCSYYGTPRHMVMGFSGAPWQWRPARAHPDWLQAPGILAELTVRSIFLPLKQSDCPY